MYKSGNSYTQRADKAITQVALYLPFILIAYGLFAQFGLVFSPKHVDFFWFSIIMTIFLFFGLMQYIRPGKTALISAIKLVQFHFIGSIYLLFIVGFNSPISIFYPVLIIASYTYFDKTGIFFSILALFAVTAINILLWNGSDITLIIADMTTFLTISTTGIIVVIISRTHEMMQRELNESKMNASIQKDRITTIVNNLTDAIISTDMDGVVRVYNAASLNLLDTNSNLNGHHIDKVLPLIDQDNNKISLISEFNKSKAVVQRDDLNYFYSDGEKIRLETTYTPIRNGYSRSQKSEKRDGYIIILRDITKEKSLEEERDEYISVISHELRTPITIAEGSISNVQAMMDHPDITSAMLKDSMKVAHEQVIFLGDMVNDLSALSRAENGIADKPEDIDVRELANNLMARYTEEAKKKMLHLNLDLGPKVSKIHVSKLYIEELLQNFMTNAIKYTKHGSVTIIIEQNNNIIKFSVKDTGIGISKTDQAKIFDKFFRSDDYRTHESSGTGLGLYVAAKLARQLGTKIELASRLNFGSTFSFSLPAAQEIKDKS